MVWENILKEDYSITLAKLILDVSNLDGQKAQKLEEVSDLMLELSDTQGINMITKYLDMEEEAQQHLLKIVLFLKERENMR
tara:strand:- start:851 stop:1093 length:243 start_codon:yes stop_codon:yes gene_type:complete